MSLSGKAGCKKCNKQKVDPQRVFLQTITTFCDMSMPLGMEFGIRNHWVRGVYEWWSIVR